MVDLFSQTAQILNCRHKRSFDYNKWWDFKVVSNFKYIGSTFTINNHAEKEIYCRIQSACASFGKLEKRLWARSAKKLETKCRVYKTVVLMVLFYSTETYTLYKDHIKRLEQCNNVIWDKLWGSSGAIMFQMFRSLEERIWAVLRLCLLPHKCGRKAILPEWVKTASRWGDRNFITRM